MIAPNNQILNSVRYQPCRVCGIHGRIIFRNGSRSYEFCSIEIGLLILHTLLQEKFILWADYTAITKELTLTPLALLDKEALPELYSGIQEINEAMYKGELAEADEQLLHDLACKYLPAHQGAFSLFPFEDHSDAIVATRVC